MAYEITNECICCGACMSECPVEIITEGAEMWQDRRRALYELRRVRRRVPRRRDTGESLNEEEVAPDRHGVLRRLSGKAQPNGVVAGAQNLAPAVAS